MTLPCDRMEIPANGQTWAGRDSNGKRPGLEAGEGQMETDFDSDNNIHYTTSLFD